MAKKGLNFKDKIIHASLGGIITIFLVIIILLAFRCYDYSPIYIINKIALDEPVSEILADSTKLTKLETIIELEEKGILLTPKEYTSNIAGFYNTLITVLVSLFVLFSLIGYFSIRVTSKKDIKEHLDEMLDDSIKFRSTIVESVIAAIGDTLVSKEDYETYQDSIQSKIEAALDEVRTEIRDSAPASTERIVTPQKK